MHINRLKGVAKMTDTKERSIELCQQLDVLYWEDAFMGPHMRGSKVRVKPHKDMMLERRYLKQVVVMQELKTVLFDSLYVDHYQNVTGVDFRLQWFADDKTDAAIAIKDVSSSIALETLAKFLKSGSISLVGSNPRHSLLIKFKIYLEAQNDDRS